MAQLRLKLFVLPVLFISALLISLSSGNIVEGFEDNNLHHIHHVLLHKGMKVSSRKLVWVPDATMHDYDDAGANPKHDPRRRPGRGP